MGEAEAESSEVTCPSSLSWSHRAGKWESWNPNLMAWVLKASFPESSTQLQQWSVQEQTPLGPVSSPSWAGASCPAGAVSTRLIVPVRTSWHRPRLL